MSSKLTLLTGNLYKMKIRDAGIEKQERQGIENNAIGFMSER